MNCSLFHRTAPRCTSGVVQVLMAINDARNELIGERVSPLWQPSNDLDRTAEVRDRLLLRNSLLFLSNRLKGRSCSLLCVASQTIVKRFANCLLTSHAPAHGSSVLSSFKRTNLGFLNVKRRIKKNIFCRHARRESLIIGGKHFVTDGRNGSTSYYMTEYNYCHCAKDCASCNHSLLTQHFLVAKNYFVFVSSSQTSSML